MMRILVGTLYCGENEFDDCRAAIHSQTHVQWDHFVIANKPNKEAHQSLYSEFMSRADEFDFFVKVDADMVLTRPTVFEEIVSWMEAHPDIDDLQIAVDDFFSDQLIAGMHAFRSGVRWNQDAEQVFVDDWPVPVQRRHTDFCQLAPAALHCPNPSAFQSLHFGMHKGIKVVEADQQGRRRGHAMFYHLTNIERTFQHYRRSGDPRLGYASIGAELALQRELTAEHIDYSHPLAAEHLQAYLPLKKEALLAEVLTLRRRSGRFFKGRKTHLLKGKIRQAAIRFATSIGRVMPLRRRPAESG